MRYPLFTRHARLISYCMSISCSLTCSAKVERDLRIRRKIRAIYNRNREDFSALKEFNDYEEDVEDIIFVLVHGTEHEKKIKMEVLFLSTHNPSLTLM